MIPSAFKRLMAVALSALLLCTSLHAQQRVTLSGTVVDALGPVISAGVVQVGSTNGTVTDMDGHFTITVPAGSTVEISAPSSWKKTISNWKKQSWLVTASRKRVTSPVPSHP